MTDEDKKLILKWSGWTIDNEGWWYEPNVEHGIIERHWGDYRNFPILDLYFYFKYVIPQLSREYRNWKSVLHDWVDQCTGDYEKDTLLLSAQTIELIKGEKIE